MRPTLRRGAALSALLPGFVVWIAIVVALLHVPDVTSHHHHDQTAAAALAAVHGHSHAPGTPAHRHAAAPESGESAATRARLRQQSAAPALPGPALMAVPSGAAALPPADLARLRDLQPRARAGPRILDLLNTLLI